MTAQFTLTTPAKLIRGDQTAQFGDGYRQVGGPTVAEGTVGELMERVRSMPSSETNKVFFKIDDVINVWTFDEVSNALSN